MSKYYTYIEIKAETDEAFEEVNRIFDSINDDKDTDVDFSQQGEDYYIRVVYKIND